MPAGLGDGRVRELRYTLVAEGSSDALLVRILDWLWQQCVGLRATGSFFDPRRLRPAPDSLCERIRAALEHFPCDVLCVHRDADNRDPEERRREILKAVGDAHGCLVCVVPVRMTEAWLLFDEAAIRSAAGNPNGRRPLLLPSPTSACERLPDPKESLLRMLREACGLQGRRLKKFSPELARARVADVIDDFTPLRSLQAFQVLEDEVRQAADEWRRHRKRSIP